jgi:hypothetical protein
MMISELTESSLNYLNVTPAVKSRSQNFLSPTKASKARHEALLKAGRKNAGVGNALIRAGRVLKNNDIEEKTVLTNNGTKRAGSSADGILQTVGRINNNNVNVGSPPRELQAPKYHQLWGPAVTVPVGYKYKYTQGKDKTDDVSFSCFKGMGRRDAFNHAEGQVSS